MAEQRPILDQVNFVVRDMDASLAFYRRLGIEIPDRSPDWDGHHRSAENQGGIDFDLDSAASAREWNEGSRGPACLVSFRVASRDEVDRVYADLAGAGYKTQQPPFDAFWGSRFAIVEDPDGNAVGLMSPRDDSFRGASTPPNG